MKYLLELKTTSEDCSVGSFYWKKLTLDNQVSMYIAAARDMGHDVGGVVYDVIRKTGLRPTGKGTETPASYESRIVAQIAEEPDRYFMRGVIVRTVDEVAEHEADVWQMADLIRLARNAGRWPRYVGSCVMYGSTCDYWAVCAEGGDIGNDTIYKTREPMSGTGVVVGHNGIVSPEKVRLPILSASAMSTWRACPRKYYYGYELRRRKVGEDSKPLWFGKLIHSAVEAYNLTDKTAGDPLASALVVCDTAKEPHEAAHARALLRGYHARWADAPLRIIATEAPFVRPLRNPDTGGVSRTFELGGFVDAIVEETT